jgi:hypothetical protein
VPSIEDQEADIDRVGSAERPHVKTFTADLPIDKRVGSFPRSVAFCSHSHRSVEWDYMPQVTASQANFGRLFWIRRPQKANFKPS